MFWEADMPQSEENELEKKVEMESTTGQMKGPGEGESAVYEHHPKQQTQTMKNNRKVWKRRLRSLGCIFIIYLSCCVAVVTFQVISVMMVHLKYDSKVNPLKLHPHKSVLHPKRHIQYNDNSELLLQALEFKFSRKDLRLRFQELSPVPHDIFYDNADTFACVQSRSDQRHPNITDDLWCLSRPDFLDEYKNPCFITPDPGWYEDTICLPYFHILGADKCGTTDFHNKLIQHPQIVKHVGNLGKESYYWCWLRYGIFMLTSIGRWKWYQYVKYFFSNATREIVTEYVDTGEQLILGDATPMDLWDFRGWPREPHNKGREEPVVLTPHLMRHMYKDPSFFVLMRDPVERLYSDYLFMGVDLMLTPEDFAQDVPIAIKLLRDCLAVNTTRQCFFSDDMYHRMPVRLHIGCYSIFLREWLSVFHRRNFFFLRAEQWYENTTTVLQNAFEFLDVDPRTEKELKKMVSTETINQTVQKKRVGKMLAQTRALLTEFYTPFNEDLAKLMGDDRYLWKKGDNSGRGRS